jgi:WD40 repeat protein/class 3 adenylate cyclase
MTERAGTGSDIAVVTAAARAFLIADVRGYTRFTRERGDVEAALLATRFARLAEDAVEARGGRIVELRGDEALAVFDSASQAVLAAVEFVAVCREGSVPDGGLALPVGIGIDAGEAVPVGDGFRGAALNTAARLCSQAAGGQVLVTTRVAETADDTPGVAFEGRGPFELKGLGEPVQVLEAAEAGPAREAGVTVPREELPLELERGTPLVGRARELSWLRGAWRQAARGYGRALVVSGGAGIGKTRLAAELAGIARDDDGAVSYAGAGGTAAAKAVAALDQAIASPHATLLVLDDVDATADTTASALLHRLAALESSATLVVCLLRDADNGSAVERLLEEVDGRGDSHRRLAPLDAEGVRAIALAYAPNDVDEIPIESIARSSGGVPAHVHDLVADWAEQEASRRLAAAAEFLALERRRRGDDLQFANTVIGLKLGRLYRSDRVEPGSSPSVSPYKGLAPFEESDAALFFGREQLVGELAARTVGAGLLAVVGASGSGKSSVIAAGLLPSLRAGLLPGSERWRTVSMRPGEHPTAELPSGSMPDRLVLVVDQLEELFTLCADEFERSEFVARLVETASDPERAVVVLGLRADFYGHCGVYPELARRVAENQVLVGPMGADELRRAIELPARRSGTRVESALVERLVDEAGSEPGSLPLLSTALVELWGERDGDRLRLSTYERVGGVRGAVARLAESSYEQLSAEEQDAARRLLLRLVALGDDGVVVKRRVHRSELDLETDAVAAAVVERLTADRLLTAHDASIEVAHEALLREWPRFQEWLAEDAQGRELRDHLVASAKRWDASGRDEAELYRGARLAATSDWAAGRERELNALERSFLAESRAYSERDAERQRRQNRLLRGLLAGAVVLLVAAVAGGIFALSQRQSAQDHARVALARQLGAEAIVEPRLDRAMLLAREATRLDPSTQTSGDLLSTLLRSPSALGTFSVPLVERPLTLSLSPNGRTLAVGGNSGDELLYDVRTHRQIGRLGGIGWNGFPFVYTPDGRDAVTVTDTPALAVVDARNGKVVRPLSFDKVFANEPTAPVDPLLVTPDGRTLALVYAVIDPATQVEGQAYVDRFDLRTGRRTASTRLPGARGLLAATLVDGGKAFLTVDDGRATTWDLASLRPLRTVHFKVPSGAVVGAVSANGSEAAIPTRDGGLDFIDLVSGKVTPASGGSTSPIRFVVFTPDGRMAVSGGDSALLTVWRTGQTTAAEQLAGHAGVVTAIAVSADGKTLFSSSLDGAVFEWDVSGGRRFGTLFDLGPESVAASTFVYAPPLAVSRTNGLIAVSPNSNARVTLLSPALHVVKSFAVSADPSANVQALAMSPAHDAVAVAWSVPGKIASAEGAAREHVQIWDLRERPRLVRDLDGISGPVTDSLWLPDIAWSPDGSRLALVDALTGPGGPPKSGSFVLWDANSGRVVSRLTRGAGAYVAFSRDGLVATAWQHGVLIQNAQTGAAVRTIRTLGGIGPLAFAPDGQLATGSHAGTVQLWNPRTGREIGRATQVAAAPVASIAFAPDSQTFVTTGGSDGVAKIWSAGTLQQLGADLPGTAGTWMRAAYTADGKSIVVASRSGRGWLWPATTAAWERQACRVAGRNLTREEWSRFVGNRSYANVCPGLGR